MSAMSVLQVRLNESQSKNKLYFGNLPRSYTQKQLEDELKKLCKGAPSW
jgi:RNA recognition motif-containing protein